jgi:hypothetical protein
MVAFGLGSAALTLDARYEIGAGFDYLYVQASTDGGTTWTSLDATAGGEAFVRTARHQRSQLRLAGPQVRQHGVSPGSGTGPGGTTVQCL